MKKQNSHCALSMALAAVLVGLTFWTVPAVAGNDVKITSAAFKYDGINYFRGKAENVNLASYGEKKTPVGQTNYLAVQDDIKRVDLGKVTVKISGPYSIDWSKYSSTDVNAGIKYIGAAGVTGSFSRDAAKSANLKLVKFSIDEGQLKKLLNNYAVSARKFLKDEGADSRVVSEVWIVMEATLASQVTTGGSVTGEGTANGIKVTISASGSSTSTSSITIPTDTTFAYLLHKVKKWDKDKVDDLEDDQHGSF
jgi:hypothetical protein